MPDRPLTAHIALPAAGLLLLFASAGDSDAQTVLATCTVSMTSVAFGSINPTTAANADAIGTLSVTCSGASLGGSATVCVAINQGTGGATAPDDRRMAQGGLYLSFGLYKDSAFTQPFGGPWSSLNDVLAVPVNLPVLGSTTVTRPVYGRIPPQPGVSPGTYASTLTVSSTNALLLNLGSCTGQVLSWNSSSTFIANATVPKTCRLDAHTLDFGSRGLLNSTVDAATTIDATCTADTPYTLSLGPGLSGAADPANRKMSKGADKIAYGIYRDFARTLPWGWTAGVNTVIGTGNGGKQSIPVYGRVPAQPTPAPGVYTDTVVVTLTY